MIFIYMQMENYCLSNKDTDFITWLLICFYLFIVSMEIWIPSLAVQIEAISELAYESFWQQVEWQVGGGWVFLNLGTISFSCNHNQSSKLKRKNRSLVREEKTEMLHSLFSFLYALLLDKAVAKMRENRLLIKLH